ncbi:MAG: isoprenoid biosynthesis glyoxalase ElbB [Gammaproteobacteria bacterium]
MKQVAVVFSGCGVYDGSEINEAVLTLLAIDKLGAKYQCFAPNIEQRKVVNHLTQDKMPESRNVLIESARIARGQIKDLLEADASKFDALIFPGGFGAAINLCDFAVKGPDCEILPQVRALVESMYRLSKPVGFICIAPAMIPRLYPKGVTLTIGTDEATAEQIEKMGGAHLACPVERTIVDKNHKVVSTPAYMLADRISEAQVGIEQLVKEVLKLT